MKLKTAAVKAAPMTIAVSGIKGSFTEEAASKFLSDSHLKARMRYDVTPKRVFADVTEGRADLGIVPLYNSSGGIVLDTIRAMSQHLFEPRSLIEVNIQQNLLVLPGKRKKDIKRIVSHTQAFAQSKLYLARHWPGIERIDYDNTALAAQDLAKGKLDPSSAVIASAKAAELFGLETLESSIQDVRFNFTTFLIFSKDSRH